MFIPLTNAESTVLSGYIKDKLGWKWVGDRTVPEEAGSMLARYGASRAVVDADRYFALKTNFMKHNHIFRNKYLIS
jgi:hypothetical protein